MAQFNIRPREQQDIIDAEIVEQNLAVNDATFAQHGLVPYDGVNEIRPQDMFEEVDVADVVRLSDKAKEYKVRFTDAVYSMNPADFVLPKAPFATGSTDELLNDKVNGLTTQTAHSKGDIVVIGNELIIGDNSTFDSSIGDWVTTKAEYSTVTHEDSFMRIVVGKNYRYQGAKLDLGLVVGMEYTVSFNLLNTVAGSILVGNNSTIANSSNTDNTIGAKTISFVANSQYLFITDTDNSQETTINIDNISVKLKDQSYIALQDTTAGALLSDTAKFKPIPYVTKQVALLVEKTVNGAILNTVKPLVNMYGEESVLTYESDIFSELGYSQKADRVWTDGSSEYILIGLKTYLNDGAYHSWINPLGSRKFSDDKFWYDTTDVVGGLYDCF